MLDFRSLGLAIATLEEAHVYDPAKAAQVFAKFRVLC